MYIDDLTTDVKPSATEEVLKLIIWLVVLILCFLLFIHIGIGYVKT